MKSGCYHISSKLHQGEIVRRRRLNDRQMFVLNINTCIHATFSKQKLRKLVEKLVKYQNIFGIEAKQLELS